jgi:Crp-like helix-turn-helix domain
MSSREDYKPALFLCCSAYLVRKRLARVLLLLAGLGEDGKPETVIAKISQDSLAEMTGTTRSRVSFL